MSTNEIGFIVDFHSPFRVGAAYPVDGVDQAADLSDPLPADHLKGLMRAAAVDLVAIGVGSTALLEEVFGTERARAPWTWFGAIPAGDGWRRAVRSRVAIDDHSHAALKDHLVAAHQVWARQARFQICPLVEDIPGHDRQAALLRASARHIHHLGAWRRRGLGWVTIRPDHPNPDQPAADLEALRAVVV